jgi:hypothetical protein
MKGTTRGRKPHPRLNPNGMTLAAQRRFHVATAAHNARLFHAWAAKAGKPVSWATAIDRAIAPHEGAITHEAVERQIFPRAADRKSRNSKLIIELVMPAGKPPRTPR